MSVTLFLVPFVSVLILVAAGYLFGARAGASARDALREALQKERDATLAERAKAAVGAEKDLTDLRQKLTAAETELGQKREVADELKRRMERVAVLERELAAASARADAKELSEKELERRGAERELAVRQLSSEVAAQKARLEGAEKEIDRNVKAAAESTRALEQRSMALRLLETELEKRKVEEAKEREATHNTIKSLEGQLARESDTSMRRMRDELKQLATTLNSQRERDAQTLEAAMQRVLSPVAVHERVVADLARLDVGDRPSTTRLSDLLEGIARTGGFGTVLLCDEVGLPLALTEAAKSPDLIAAVSSMLISLADRFVAHGAPSPVAAVFRDDTNQSFVHRIFRIGGDRFVLSASAHGLFLPPEVLDPAITKLERVLGDFVSAA